MGMEKVSLFCYIGFTQSFFWTHIWSTSLHVLVHCHRTVKTAGAHVHLSCTCVDVCVRPYNYPATVQILSTNHSFSWSAQFPCIGQRITKQKIPTCATLPSTGNIAHWESVNSVEITNLIVNSVVNIRQIKMDMTEIYLVITIKYIWILDT